MQSIVVVLDSSKLENPDLDIIYSLPDRAEELTGKAVQDNGYRYLDAAGRSIGIWLKTEAPDIWWPKVVELLKTERFCENDLSESALVLISGEENAEIEICRQVYPELCRSEVL